MLPHLQVKNKALQTIVKILQYTPAESLTNLLEAIPISSFTAGLFSSQEPTTVAGALRTAELLQIKLPKIFTSMLLKEGVVHAIESLSSEAPAPPPEQPKTRRSSSRLKASLSSFQKQRASIVPLKTAISVQAYTRRVYILIVTSKYELGHRSNSEKFQNHSIACHWKPLQELSGLLYYFFTSAVLGCASQDPDNISLTWRITYHKCFNYKAKHHYKVHGQFQTFCQSDMHSEQGVAVEISFRLAMTSVDW